RCHAPHGLLSLPTRRSSDLPDPHPARRRAGRGAAGARRPRRAHGLSPAPTPPDRPAPSNFRATAIIFGSLVRTRTPTHHEREPQDRKSTRLNSSHVKISYAV